MSAHSSTDSHLRPDNRKTVFCLLENILKQSFIAAGVHLYTVTRRGVRTALSSVHSNKTWHTFPRSWLLQSWHLFKGSYVALFGRTNLSWHIRCNIFIIFLASVGIALETFHHTLTFIFTTHSLYNSNLPYCWVFHVIVTSSITSLFTNNFHFIMLIPWLVVIKSSSTLWSTPYLLKVNKAL